MDWWMFARYAYIYLSCVLLFGGAVRLSSLVAVCAPDTHSTCTHAAQVALHHVWLVSLLMAALWGVFSALVTLTPGHDSR